MRESGTTEPERKTQRAFRLRGLCALLVLLAAISLFDRWLAFVPNREEHGRATAVLRFAPVELAQREFGPFRNVRAWDIRSNDPRIGGISGLALDGGELVALTDSGVLIRFAIPTRPTGAADVREVPGGPGNGRFKRNRDSEALVRDPRGRGWWIAFENRHELWLYDRDFNRALQRIELGWGRWRSNKGVEGIAADGDGLLLFPEDDQSILRVTSMRARKIELAHPIGRISDAARIAPNRMIVVERRLTPFGFRNSLVSVEQEGDGYRFARRVALPLRAIDNVEAIAVEARPDGGRRLWLMTDDNYQRPLRTLLIALDMPGTGPSDQP